MQCAHVDICIQNLHANSEYLLCGAGEPTRVIHLPAFDTNEEKDVAFVRSLGVPIKIKSPVYVGKSRVDYPDLPTCNDELHGQVCTQHKVTEVPSFRMNNSLGAVVYVPLSAINDANIDDFVDFSTRQGGQYPLVYDDVIRCLGWSQLRLVVQKII